MFSSRSRLIQTVRSCFPVLVLLLVSTRSVSAGQQSIPDSGSSANSRKIALSFSSYIGGAAAQEGRTLVADSSGFVYVAGRTNEGGKNGIFLTKMRADGS